MGPNIQTEVKGATQSVTTNTQEHPPEMDCNPDGVSHGCFMGACTLCLGGSSSSTPDPNSAATATPRRRRGGDRSGGGTPSTAARVTRANFASLTAQSLLPNAQFTDHESIPPLNDARTNFLAAYPQYADSDTADMIRNREYRNLSSHVCLDYSGLGLFSHAQGRSMVAPSPSSPASAPSTSYSYSNFRHPPSFTIAYKSTSLKSQVLGGDAKPTATSAASGVGRLESALRARIMEFLHLSNEDYHMVITANRASAFKLLAESYPFHTNKRLLTVYDYESEAVTTMVDSAAKRDAKPASASFTWPNMRVHSSKLKKAVVGSGSSTGAKKGKKRTRGLFVFPLQSRVTGSRYSYLWMSLAQEHGWHVLLDACALGPKDMDTLGLSLFRPDFLICSFFKVFGENPSGFACLFVKRSVTDVVESSALARSVGVVRIVPTRSLAGIPNYNSDDPDSSQVLEDDCDIETTRSFSGPISTPLSVQGYAAMMGNGSTKGGQTASSKKRDTNGGGKVGTSEIRDAGAVSEEEDDGIGDSPTASTFSFRPPTPPSSDTTAGIFIEDETEIYRRQQRRRQQEEEELIECRGLDHADSLGLATITGRLRCIINWLVLALTKLRHPHSENAHSLVRIYGPKVKFDRGPALAFNVFDWKGEKIDPTLVQKLADRSNISLTCGFLHNIWFPEKYEADKATVLEKRVVEQASGGKKREKADFGVAVVTASLGFLASFEDAYKVWAFVAKFLDADFVEKERWRYMALNQKMVEV